MHNDTLPSDTRQPPSHRRAQPQPSTSYAGMLAAHAAQHSGLSASGTTSQGRKRRTRAARQAATVARLLLHVADDGTLGHVAHLKNERKETNEKQTRE